MNGSYLEIATVYTQRHAVLSDNDVGKKLGKTGREERASSQKSCRRKRYEKALDVQGEEEVKYLTTFYPFI